MCTSCHCTRWPYRNALVQTKCHAFVDPYVEHDSLTLLLDLILLKRGVYRHLLYNRGPEPRKAADDGKDTVPSTKVEKRAWLDDREKVGARI